MLTVVVILAVILSLFIETFLAIILALITFIAWFKFNQRAASVGLFNSNLFAYERAKMSGMPKEDSIAYMVSTRYPQMPFEMVHSQIESVLFGLLPIVENRFSEPDKDLKCYLLALFCYENNIPFSAISTKLQDKYIGQIEKEYRKRFHNTTN